MEAKQLTLFDDDDNIHARASSRIIKVLGPRYRVVSSKSMHGGIMYEIFESDPSANDDEYLLVKSSEFVSR